MGWFDSPDGTNFGRLVQLAEFRLKVNLGSKQLFTI